jgi:hypothetical protein
MDAARTIKKLNEWEPCRETKIEMVGKRRGFEEDESEKLEREVQR